MNTFVELFNRLDQTKATKEKLQLIKNYFLKASSSDAVWALYFLSGHRFKRLITGRMLLNWSMELLKLPPWLMLESYSAVGDIAETISLLLLNRTRNQNSHPFSLAEWIEERILPLQKQKEEVIKEKIFSYWSELDSNEIFIVNKILSGTLRIGTSFALTLEGLSQALGIPKETLSQKLMGDWTPTSEFFDNLKVTDDALLKANLNPYPFYLASPLEKNLEDLKETQEWQAEWKWDGIRAQCVHRKGNVAIWSRGNELISHQFPEIVKAISHLEDGLVVDGEILAFTNELPLPFGELQKRLGRKKVTPAMLKDIPIVFMIYDILEHQGKDVRKLPFSERRTLFENWTDIDPIIKISPKIAFKNWDELKERREESKVNRTEGIILKKKSSHYGVGRRRGSWWKYKIDAHSIDTILLYAQPGQGWRANLYTDYTFGVWNGKELVPIAKAYSGLSQDEIYELDHWIRRNTLEKYGPVRKVKAEQVFEIAFEGIQESKRHKAGIALRFPRIYRWRKDKLPGECDSLERIKNEFFITKD